MRFEIRNSKFESLSEKQRTLIFHCYYYVRISKFCIITLFENRAEISIVPRFHNNHANFAISRARTKRYHLQINWTI